MLPTCPEDACTGEHSTQKQAFNMDLSEQQDLARAGTVRVTLMTICKGMVTKPKTEQG